MCDGIQPATMERLGFVLAGGMAFASHPVVEEDLRAIRTGLAIVLGLAPWHGPGSLDRSGGRLR